MPTTDPDSWAYHDDFAELIVVKEPKVAVRLLEAADIALSFARALVAREFERANAMLSEELNLSFPPERLKRELEEMINYAGDENTWPNYVQVVTGGDISDMVKWLRKKPSDFGWAYVAIGGNYSVGGVYNEAVSVTVAQEGERLVISEIEWGRP
jgi:hypothetical protein